jgi:hypothetical protein
MTTPPGQEPRPGFTPRGGQARPGPRAGDARFPDKDPRWRDEPRTRRPNAPGSNAPGSNAAGNSAAGNNDSGNGRTREPGRDAGDRRADGRPPGQRPASGSRPPGGSAFSDRDRERGFRGGPGWPGGDGRRGQRDSPNAPRSEASRRPAPSFSPAGQAASAAATRGSDGGTAKKRPPADAARSGLFATPALRWIGRLPVKRAVLAFTGTVLAGTILTIVMGQEPGFLLGFFLVLGSVAATAAVRRGGAHKFIPLPALAYLAAAVFAGMAHDSGSLNTSRQFVVDFLTWIGGSFVAVTASTILVVLIALTRWLLSGRLVSGQLPATGPARTPARPASREPRGNRDDWGSRGERAARGNADPWRNPGQPDERGRRADGTWPSQTFRGDRERRGEDTQGRPDGRGRDEGTWPSQGMRDDRSTGDRGPGGDPRDQRPREQRPLPQREDRGRYDDQDPRDDRRSPSGPRDLW